MRNFIAAGAAVVLAITSGVAGQGGCRVNTKTTIEGNDYCDAVKHIHYKSVSTSGKYNKVVDMTGCQTAVKHYKGPMAPFDEELSMHFNGPMHLKRFAVYTPGSSQKGSVKPSARQRRHDHQHFHEHDKEIREIQERGTGSWGRQAYYSAADGIREGLVFLNTTWDGSLAYASADGSSHTASPTTLKDVLLADENEVIIMSDKLCSNGECGAVHKNSVVHHGFGGAEKAFLMEFSMPITKRKGLPGPWEKKFDQPKIWALNAHIPRTGQYNGCSCWRSTCGELDLFETLHEGSTRCKSTFHMEKMGGNSDYFERPTTNTITAAVIFTGDSGSVHIKVLDAGHSFDKTLGANDIEAMCKDDQATSVFDVSKLPNAHGNLP